MVFLGPAQNMLNQLPAVGIKLLECLNFPRGQGPERRVGTTSLPKPCQDPKRQSIKSIVPWPDGWPTLGRSRGTLPLVDVRQQAGQTWPASQEGTNRPAAFFDKWACSDSKNGWRSGAELAVPHSTRSQAMPGRVRCLSAAFFFGWAEACRCRGNPCLTIDVRQGLAFHKSSKECGKTSWPGPNVRPFFQSW